jgi:hypothetical protein
MTSHELARLLLNHEDLPVAVHAMNHTYAEGFRHGTHGPLKVGMMVRGKRGHEGGPHVVIGSFSRQMLNYPNEWVIEMWHGSAPKDWPEPWERPDGFR